MRRVTTQPFPDEPLLQEPADLGAAIRSARTATGLTIEAAALALGIGRNTLLDLENGAPSVSLGTALLAARELGVSLFVSPSKDRERVRRLMGAPAH